MKERQRRQDNGESRVRLSMSNVSNRSPTYPLHCVIKQETTEKPSKPKLWRDEPGHTSTSNAVMSKQNTYLV